MMIKDATCIEEWRPVVGRIGYSVSSLGNVRSETREIRCRGRWGKEVVRVYTGRILVPQKATSGYRLVHLGSGFQRDVHVLVLEAFVGPRPPEREAAHLDGDPWNAAVSNLQWVTRAENQAHRVMHGTSNRGRRQWKSRLTESDVRAIRADARFARLVAADYGIALGTVQGIKARTKWAWLE